MGWWEELVTNPVIQQKLPEATLETLQMVGVSALLTALLGLPLGLLLHATSIGGLTPNRVVNSVVGFVANIVRSLPFLILMIAVIPLTRARTGAANGRAATRAARAGGVPPRRGAIARPCRSPCPPLPGPAPADRAAPRLDERSRDPAEGALDAHVRLAIGQVLERSSERRSLARGERRQAALGDLAGDEISRRHGVEQAPEAVLGPSPNAGRTLVDTEHRQPRPSTHSNFSLNSSRSSA